MPKRRDKGSGSIYKRASDGLWVATVELPPGADGRRRRKVVTSRDKTVVQNRIRDLQSDVRRHGDMPTRSETLEHWLRYWLTAVVEPNAQPRTTASYRSLVEQQIVPAIGRIRLDRLNVTHIRRLHTTMDAKGLAAATVQSAHRVLLKALSDAEIDASPVPPTCSRHHPPPHPPSRSSPPPTRSPS